MEIYNEVVAAGNLSMEISVRNKTNGTSTGYWVYCTARNHEGHILWETTVSHDNGSLRMHTNVEDALHETRKLFSEPDDYEVLGPGSKQKDKTR